MRNIIYMMALVLVMASQAAFSSDLYTCKAQSTNSYVSCKRLANSGNPDGMFGLGMLYLEGNGVKRNFSKSFKLMYKAAMLGHAAAQLQVGQAYVNGQGVTQDFEEGYAWFFVAKANGNAIAQQGIDYMDQRGLIQKGRMNSVTKRANNLYAKTKNKSGFNYGQADSSLPVSDLEEYCDMIMPTVGSVITLRKYGKSRSTAHELMVGMTDQRSIKMMEGVIDWVWTTKTPVSQMHDDFKRKCLNQSSEISFIFP